MYVCVYAWESVTAFAVLEGLNAKQPEGSPTGPKFDSAHADRKRQIGFEFRSASWEIF